MEKLSVYQGGNFLGILTSCIEFETLFHLHQGGYTCVSWRRHNWSDSTPNNPSTTFRQKGEAMTPPAKWAVLLRGADTLWVRNLLR
jgi:hypothetical protein